MEFLTKKASEERVALNAFKGCQPILSVQRIKRRFLPSLKREVESFESMLSGFARQCAVSRRHCLPVQMDFDHGHATLSNSRHLIYLKGLMHTLDHFDVFRM